MSERAASSAWPAQFDLVGEPNKKLLEAFRTGYPTRDSIDAFLITTRIRPDEINMTGAVRAIWIDVLQKAARAGLIDNLLDKALDDPMVGVVHDQFRACRAGPPPDPASSDRPGAAPPQLAREATQRLVRAGPSRSPILIALELKGEELEEKEITRSACHLIVSLTPEQAAAIEGLARGVLTGAGSIPQIVEAGTRVWSRLTEAEPRLRALPGRIAAPGLAQPIAWCGRAELLARLRAALQIVHTTPGGFLAAATGQYLMPAYRPGNGLGGRTIRARDWDTDPAIGEIDLREQPADRRTTGRAWLEQLARTDIAIVVHPANRPVLAELGLATQDAAGPPTRAVLSFGSPADAPAIAALLSTVPFVGTAEPALAQPELLAALREALAAHSGTSAMPCVVAAVRAAWIAAATTRGDADACRLGLGLTSWCWIGLPLFSRTFGAVEPAKYPHLMDLRSVAERGWYFDRRERIHKAYWAHEMAAAESGQRFHLYLSGAGGTGKSCFLQRVRELIHQQESSVAVYYRVDAPSSLWENVAARIREITIFEIAQKLDQQTVDAIRALTQNELGDFLERAVTELRRADGFESAEIAVFIDQLERTFESGDEPNQISLQTISRAVIDLLERVGTGKGVRVFIASRKQYLPDFIGSFRKAAEHGLEFNVLQTISDEPERAQFVEKVLDWCRDDAQQLVGPDVKMDNDAKRTLAGEVDGHPLNINLALIQLLSGNVTGTITEDEVKRREPWNKLFLLDLQAAARDVLDWYFLLAMAHARTEIVRFEEVWWRIRMVNAELTTRVEDLQRHGVKERLWLLGILGRTVHARPDGGDQMGFVEFFHANLRDYLLREVMGQGRSGLGVGGGREGTPAAWRALDRISAFAHDWAQTPQLLLAEEIRVLMEHRQQVIEPSPTGEFRPFDLLFLRDRAVARGQLGTAAQECFALSALVHDEAGKWAIEQLFPDADDRGYRCGDWVRRCPEHRAAVLRHLVTEETEAARKVLLTALLGLDQQARADLSGYRHNSPERLRTEVLLGLDGLPRGELQRAVGLVLTEPLYAAGWRKEVLHATLTEALRRVGARPDRLPEHVRAFLVVACDRNRETLEGVRQHCRDLLDNSDDATERTMASELDRYGSFDGWLKESAAAPPRRGVGLAERGGSGAPLALLVAGGLRAEITAELLAGWSSGLQGTLGVPLPELTLLPGEAAENEIELHSYGERLARGVFFPGRLRVAARRWGTTLPDDAIKAVDRGEDVLWLRRELVAARTDRVPSQEFEPALAGWLAEHCRRSIERIFDGVQEITFLRAAASTEEIRRRLSGDGRSLLRSVLVSLIEEGVPIGGRGDAILRQLAEHARSSYEPGPITQKIRESMKDGIWRSVADSFGEVTTILLAPQLEEALANAVNEKTGSFDRVPAEATALAAAIQRTVIRIGQDPTGPPAVVVTVVPRLRQALARQLRGLDYRLPVLSFTELPQQFSNVAGGLLDIPADPPNPP